MGLTAPTTREALEQLKRAVELDGSFAGRLPGAGGRPPVDRSGGRPGSPAALPNSIPRSRSSTTSLPPRASSAGELDGALHAMGRGQALAPSLPWWDALQGPRPPRARRRDAGTGGRPRLRDAGDFPPGIICARPCSPCRAASTTRQLWPARLSGATRTRARRARCWRRCSPRSSRPADGKRAAAEIAARAADAPDGCGWAGCAAMAAAAVSDPARAAAALGRIASSDAELRAWGAVNPLVDGQIALRQSCSRGATWLPLRRWSRRWRASMPRWPPPARTPRRILQGM